MVTCQLGTCGSAWVWILSCSSGMSTLPCSRAMFSQTNVLHLLTLAVSVVKCKCWSPVWRASAQRKRNSLLSAAARSTRCGVMNLKEPAINANGALCEARTHARTHAQTQSLWIFPSVRRSLTPTGKDCKEKQRYDAAASAAQWWSWVTSCLALMWSAVLSAG